MLNIEPISQSQKARLATATNLMDEQIKVAKQLHEKYFDRSQQDALEGIIQALAINYATVCAAENMDQTA